MLSCLAAAFLLAHTPRVSAESVTMALLPPPGGFPNGSGTVSLDGSTVNAAPIGPLYWTQFNPDGSPFNRPPNSGFPAPISTFCIEVGNTPVTQITPGVPYTFGVRAPLGAPTIGNDPAKVNAILQLYGDHYNTAWSAAGFTGSAASVAFQLALWELVYDGLTGNPNGLTSGGRFSVSASNFPEAGTAQGWLNSLTGDPSSFNAHFPNMELVALVAPADPDEAKLATPTQDQLTLRTKVVPAPPGLMLAGFGLVALVGRARWLRKRPTAA